MRKLLVWSGIDSWRAEAATVDLSVGGLSASGTQLGAEPVVYRLDYELEVDQGWITRRLRACVRGADRRRELALRHLGEGRSTVQAGQEDSVRLPAPGGDPATVERSLQHPSRQRHEHVSRRKPRLLRCSGEHRSFVGALELDGDGFALPRTSRVIALGVQRATAG